MHGPEWLSSPIFSLIFIGIALYFLALTIRHRKAVRDINKSTGYQILDTSKEWLFFTAFIGLSALGAHLMAEYVFHIYDITPIDRFTHGLSGMAVTAIVLNFSLTQNRKLYYSAAIGASWIAFIVWEIFEGIFVYVNPQGFIQINAWDTVIDLWIDSLGALAICFLCDELTNERPN